MIAEQVAQSLAADLAAFKPGRVVSLVLGLASPISDQALVDFANYLRQNGVEVLTADLGATDDFPLAANITLKMPAQSGYGFIPLAVLLVGAVGFILVTALVGWQVSSAVKSNIIPLAIIAGLVILGLAKISQSRTAR